MRLNNGRPNASQGGRGHTAVVASESHCAFVRKPALRFRMKGLNRYIYTGGRNPAALATRGGWEGTPLATKRGISYLPPPLATGWGRSYLLPPWPQRGEHPPLATRWGTLPLATRWGTPPFATRWGTPLLCHKEWDLPPCHKVESFPTVPQGEGLSPLATRWGTHPSCHRRMHGKGYVVRSSYTVPRGGPPPVLSQKGAW